jgi:hypothetical protein
MVLFPNLERKRFISTILALSRVHYFLPVDQPIECRLPSASYFLVILRWWCTWTSFSYTLPYHIVALLLKSTPNITIDKMPRHASLVRNDVQDSASDYASLFEEMGVQPSAQAEVFELIRDFRDRDYYIKNVTTGTTASSKFTNGKLFGAGTITKSGAIDGLSEPLKDLSDKKEKNRALAR